VGRGWRIEEWDKMEAEDAREANAEADATKIGNKYSYSGTGG
jgi:hypothetical protein